MNARERIELTVPIDGESGIVNARSKARSIARELGFGIVDQSRIATAVSELTRNIVRYASDSRGEVVIREVVGPADQPGVEIIVSDDGPGIADVALAMRDGVSSSTGLGLGLPGARRLMDEMKIESGAGRGTIVTIRKWLRPRATQIPLHG
ncbi:MAG TPA: anti-sigma regulatory factor [Nitrolancea sp.]|nr:anti-sigma regulatory factor [Nitrolancea sp.]